MSLDAGSPLPLYHQIAGILRSRITAGELRVGDCLPAMRRAAAEFAVNLHTVRHAYLALSREGLVEMQGARGTRVRALPEPPAAGAVDLSVFLAEVLRRARGEFGLGAEALAERIRATATGPGPADRPPRVTVVECSEWQCRSHAAELTGLWDVEAVTHPLDRGTAPPDGDVILATWFHYNDVRRLWPGLLAGSSPGNRIDFVTIRPDVGILRQLRARTWWVVERDEATAGAVAADLTAVLGSDRVALETFVTAAPETALTRIDAPDPILFAPRVWAELGDAAREHPRAFELRYVFDPRELHGLAARHRWPLRQATIPSR